LKKACGKCFHLKRFSIGIGIYLQTLSSQLTKRGIQGRN